MAQYLALEAVAESNDEKKDSSCLQFGRLLSAAGRLPIWCTSMSLEETRNILKLDDYDCSGYMPRT